MKNVFNDGSYEIIGAAIEVHKILGPGLLEAVYQEAFAIELRLRNISFEREVEIPVVYKGHNTAKSYRVDFLCGDEKKGKKLVELKALKEVTELGTCCDLKLFKTKSI